MLSFRVSRSKDTRTVSFARCVQIFIGVCFQVQAFTLMISHEEFNISAAGFFILDYPLLFSVLIKLGVSFSGITYDIFRWRVHSLHIW